MTIEGNWIRGAMKNDYPDVAYTVAELPEGPAGKGTLLFTQCWGIAAESPDQAAASSWCST
jgi:multiple sugar transport system substrate-binding protein